MILEHHAQLAPECRNLARGQRGSIAAIDHYQSARGTFQQGDEFEDGAFSGAGATGEEHHLACGNFE